MFTGIVAAIGMIEEVLPLAATVGPADSGRRLVIEAALLGLDDVQVGDSIAIQGACMTVVELGGPTSVQLPEGRFAVDVLSRAWPERLALRRRARSISKRHCACRTALAAIWSADMWMAWGAWRRLIRWVSPGFWPSRCRRHWRSTLHTRVRSRWMGYRSRSIGWKILRREGLPGLKSM